MSSPQDEPINVDQILKDLEQKYGGKIVLSQALVKRVADHIAANPGANLRGNCTNHDQVCILCDTGKDNCSMCDVNDLCLTAPDI